MRRQYSIWLKRQGKKEGFYSRIYCSRFWGLWRRQIRKLSGQFTLVRLTEHECYFDE